MCIKAITLWFSDDIVKLLQIHIYNFHSRNVVLIFSNLIENGSFLIGVIVIYFTNEDLYRKLIIQNPLQETTFISNILLTKVECYLSGDDAFRRTLP